MESKTSLLLKIKRNLPSFSKIQSEIGHYVIDNYPQIISLSVTDLSNSAKVSEASIVRFCKSLGCAGYQEFKLALAQEIGFSIKEIQAEVTDKDSLKVTVKKVFSTNSRALKDTLNSLDLTELDKAVMAIRKARKVEFYGVGDSAWVAADARHKFMKLGITCIADPDIHTQIMSASLLSKNDVAMGISHSGITKDTIHTMAVAKEAGATTICITNYSSPPIVKYADIKLLTASYETTFHSEAMASRIAQLSIIDCLYTSLAMKNAKISLQRIKRTQQAIADKEYGR